MADIELVIKIPEEAYKFAKECKTKGYSKHSWNISHDNIVHMIAKGTSIPKGHGRLIDADEVSKYVIIGNEDLKKCPTIIEGNKEESGKKQVKEYLRNLERNNGC